MNQLYWQVYLNLEREFLELTDTIFVNDEQLNVYSMRIADMLIRTVIEIEAISKDLYLDNGGPIVPDNEMYFDSVCMAYLDNLWNLDKKAVLVVSPKVYLEKEDNKVLYPLHKANKRGTSSSDWNKAYQSVKHNRMKKLSNGNLKHLLHGLAALYVLNLYYRDYNIDKITHTEKNNIDLGFGSTLFSVKIHRISELKSDGSYPKKSDYSECIYIEDHEPESKKVALDALKAYNMYIHKEVQNEMERLTRERLLNGMEVTDEWIKETRSILSSTIVKIKDYKLLQQFQDGLSGIRYNIVLNKEQY